MLGLKAVPPMPNLVLIQSEHSSYTRMGILIRKLLGLLGVRACTLIPAFRGQRQTNLFEFEASQGLYNVILFLKKYKIFFKYTLT